MYMNFGQKVHLSGRSSVLKERFPYDISINPMLKPMLKPPLK
jgi:hypothetical protein